MNYLEAKYLAEAWTIDHDISLEGWRSVIAVLLQRVKHLEGALQSAYKECDRLAIENDRLALDLGIRQQDFQLPNQPQLKELAEDVRELDTGPRDKRDPSAW